MVLEESSIWRPIELIFCKLFSDENTEDFKIKNDDIYILQNYIDLNTEYIISNKYRNSVEEEELMQKIVKNICLTGFTVLKNVDDKFIGICKIFKSLCKLSSHENCNNMLNGLMECNHSECIYLLKLIEENNYEIKVLAKKSIILLMFTLNLFELLSSNNIHDLKIQKFIIEIENVIFDIVKTRNESIVPTILSEVSPALQKLTQNQFLQKVLSHLFTVEPVQEPFKSCNKNSHLLLIISSIINELFNFNTKIFLNNFLKNELFLVIQCGLCNHDSLTRKRALSILKMILDKLYEMREEEFKICTNYFCYSSSHYDQHRPLWQDCLLLLETLEEKQSHIVKQVACKLQMLLSSLSKNIGYDNVHYSWLLIMLKRLLYHPNLTIVKFGIEYFLASEMEFKFGEEATFKNFIIECFLPTLNEPKLFYKSLEKNKILVYDQLNHFLKNYHCALSKDETVYFWNSLLMKLCSFTWAPIPLYYVFKSFVNVPKGNFLYFDTLKSLEEFSLTSMKCQEPLIKGASYCFILETILNFTDGPENKIKFSSKMHLLHLFNNFGILIRKTHLWSSARNWLLSNEDDTTKDDYKSSIITSLQADVGKISLAKLQDKAKLLALLLSIEMDDDNFLNYLNAFMATLICEIEPKNRPYAINKRNITSILIINSIFDLLFISLNRKKRLNLLYFNNIEEINNNTLISVKTNVICFSERINNVLDGIFSVCQGFDSLEDYYLFEACLTALEYISMISDIDSLINEKYSNRIFNHFKAKYEIFLMKRDVNISLICSTKLLMWIMGFKSVSVKFKNSIYDMLDLSIESKFLLNPILEKSNKITNREEQSDWGYLTCEQISCQWQLLNIVIDFDSLDISSCFIFINEGISSLDICRTNGVKYIFRLFKEIIPKIIKDHCKIVEKIFKKSMSKVFEYRKNDHFWIFFEEFLKIVFQNFKGINDSYFTQMREISETIFKEGEKIPGLVTTFMFHILNICEFENLDFKYKLYPIISDALLFGPTWRKDQQVLSDINHDIYNYNEHLSVNFTEGSDHYSDMFVRASAIKILSELPKDQKSNEICFIILKNMLEKDQKIHGETNRYFENSSMHRFRQRMLQSFLIMEDFLYFDSAEFLLKKMCDLLLCPSQQNSVRYLGEWIIIKIILHFPVLLEYFKVHFYETNQENPSFLVSSILILTRLSLTTENIDLINFTLKEIVPCSMGQNFSLRLHAHICFQKIWSYLEIQKNEAMLKQFSLIRESLEKTIRHGNYGKVEEKLMGKFYLHNFHPVDNYNLQTIYLDLPTLSGTGNSEIIAIEVFYNLRLKSNFISIRDETNASLQFLNSINTVTDKGEYSESKEENLETFHIQKKVTPWKNALLDNNIRLNDVFNQADKETKTKLIVVASLIDRLPNLGGLCRTCEIFGVSSFVIPDMKYLKEKEFQSISVTSENWISLEEVKTYQLTEYLKTKRAEGYTLVGVEQTSQSKSLENYEFDEKTILVLGNEKEGIPVNFIQLLDTCIEIPQHGIIRSFNVHVSGAIVIWEYVRQKNKVCG